MKWCAHFPDIFSQLLSFNNANTVTGQLQWLSSNKINYDVTGTTLTQQKSDGAFIDDVRTASLL